MNFETFLSNRKDLKKVYTHLRALKKTATLDLSNIPKSVKQRRYIISNYSNVDPNKQIEIPKEIKIKNIKVHGIECDWVTKENSDPNKRMLYIHGGSFIGGDIKTYRPLLAYLVQHTDISILSVNYRKAPEYPFPSALEDCEDVYSWLVENSINGKSRADKIFLMGDSAGGNLSTSLLLKIKNSHLPLPNVVYLVSPILDLLAKSPSINSNSNFEPIIDKKGLKLGLPLVYIKGNEVLEIKEKSIKTLFKLVSLLIESKTKLKNPLVSPIYGDLSGLPPIYIHTGEMEMLRDESLIFAEKAKKVGVSVSVKIWPDMIHAFIAFAGYLPEAEMCLNEIITSINEYSLK